MSEKSPWLKGRSDVIGKLPGFSYLVETKRGTSEPTSFLKFQLEKFEKIEVLGYNIYIRCGTNI